MSLPAPTPDVRLPDGDLDADGVQQNFEALFMAAGGGADFVGSGSPNGVVVASVGATYRNRAGGAGSTFWVKESGANTSSGWVAK